MKYSLRSLMKFSIRDLFLLTAIIAIGIGWWLDRRYISAEAAVLRNAVVVLQNEQRSRVSESSSAIVTKRWNGTNEQFLQALRKIKDWYEFADRTADPFVQSADAEKAVPALIKLLSDEDAEVRRRAAATLGKLKRRAPEVVPALILLLGDEVPNNRWHAAFALSRFGKEATAALPALKQLALDKESPVAAFATTMMTAIDPDVEIEPILIGHLGSGVLHNRTTAVQYLSEKGSEAAKPALIEAFRSETDSTTRDLISRAIVNIESRAKLSP
jgi:HEAT repeat protein